MGRKDVHTWLPFNAVDISITQTSKVTDVRFTDNIGIIVTWSGSSPVGVLTVQVSNDDAATPVNWQTLNFGSTISISGNSGTHDISINQLPYAKIRFVYTATSGTGTMTATFTQKQIGG